MHIPFIIEHSHSKGVIYVGDVGNYYLEEMDSIKTPGGNYGWPCVSAVNIPEPVWYNALCPNVDIATAGFIPAIVWYSHWTDNPNGYSIGYTGNCIAGVAMYNGAQYPQDQYQLGTKARALFYADYGHQWIRTVWIDEKNNVIDIAGDQLFAGPGLGAIVDLETDPVSGDLFYVGIIEHIFQLTWQYITGQTVRRFVYMLASATNFPPVAVASATPQTFNLAINNQPVQFSSSGSYDPEDSDVTVLWDFGDGTEQSNNPNPQHTYKNPGTNTLLLALILYRCLQRHP
jgi:hypothetical protein